MDEKNKKVMDQLWIRTHYREYLLSEHWQKLRKKRLSNANRTCYACGSRERLDVHHRTYKRVGREHLSDLIILCRDCHEAVHKMMKVKKFGLWKAARLFRDKLRKAR